MDALRYLVARLRESATWATITALLGIAGLHLSDPTIQAITAAGTGLAGLVAILLPEKGA